LFREVTDECGLKGQGGDRFSFGDFDDDGDPDMLVDGCRLYRNDSKPRRPWFTDVTKEAGFKDITGSGACWFDFNRDGLLDLVTNSGQVWIGDGKGHFTNIAPKLGISVPHGSASAIGCGDLNGDGWVDVFTGGGENGGLIEQTLWLNVQGKKLENATDEVELKSRQYGRSVIWCDFDWDGDQDIYSGNYRLQPNSLFRNEGGKLKDVGADLGVTGRNDQNMFTNPRTGQRCGYRYGHTIAASWVDLNNDGYFDLWVSNLAHKAVGKVSSDFAKQLGSDYDDRGFLCDDSNIFINQGPPDWRFRDMRQEMGVPNIPVEEYGKWKGDELWSNSACGDADNNGWMDVYVNQVYGNQPNSFALLFMNNAGKFTENHAKIPKSLWGGYGAAWADIDSDGRLDLIAGGAPQCNGKASLHVFYNQNTGNAWIGFRIKPTKNLQMIGTKVLLVQKEFVQLRQVETTMGSHTQQNDMRLHFGLGSRDSVVDVVVYWTDGTMQSLGKPEIGRYHVVEKKKTSAPSIGALTPTSVKTGAKTQFRIASGSTRAKYYWSFDGTRRCNAVTESPVVTHTYTKEGKYVVLVRVVNPDGGAAERTFVVTVK
jgi:hypothetical protein